MINLNEFDYYLPKELIAQKPAKPRDSARLLVVRENELEHRIFKEIDEYFKEGDVLVLNNTKVMPNKLSGKKSTGAVANIIIEGKEDGLYRARVNTHRPKPGVVLEFPLGLKAEIKYRKEDVFWLEFNKSLEEVLNTHGELPVPYYIKEPLQKKEDYQTEFASSSGSLAAPTSGLHFTKRQLKQLEKKGVKIVYVTLHISFGTFRKINGAVEDHKMDEESFIISPEAAEIINNRKSRLIVCGTTSFKALESASEPNGLVRPCNSTSMLFIYPGYKFKTKPDMMITNFHLPKSTLILFVSAYFGKERVLNAYKQAVEKKYRFFSFGDATLFIK